MPRFERRVLLGGLLVSVPAWVMLVLVLAWPTVSSWWLPWALIVAVGITFALARRHRRRVLYPLHSLSGLLEALRQGDYSLRGVSSSVLGDVIHGVNGLAERLQAERLDFEESSYLLSKTLHALDSAVFVFDREQRLRLLNPAGQQLLDDTPEQLFGRNATELGLAPLLEAAPRQLVNHAFAGRSGRFEVRHAPLRSSGRGGRLLVLNDVGHVLREEERQAWQRLLRVLGHEVNNSLAPIQSMAGTLATVIMREPLPEDWRQDVASGLGIIEKRSAALARFLAGYSKLARLPPPLMADVDLGTVLRKAVRLETRVPVALVEGTPVTLRADPDQLEQALINLLHNAAEASAPNGGGVRVSWRLDGHCVCIDIDDEGEGPPPSENLFIPFFTTKPGGSGIGLALVRQIAEAHQGGIVLGQRPDGPGARATLWLPCKEGGGD